MNNKLTVGMFAIAIAVSFSNAHPVSAIELRALDTSRTPSPTLVLPPTTPTLEVTPTSRSIIIPVPPTPTPTPAPTFLISPPGSPATPTVIPSNLDWKMYCDKITALVISGVNITAPSAEFDQVRDLVTKASAICQSIPNTPPAAQTPSGASTRTASNPLTVIPQKPILTSFPLKGTEGTLVKLVGKNLKGTTLVKFGDKGTTVIANTSTSIDVFVPGLDFIGPKPKGKITVVTPAGTYVSNSVFTTIPADWSHPNTIPGGI